MAEAAPPMASPAGWVNYKVDSTARGETMYATSLLAMAAIVLESDYASPGFVSAILVAHVIKIERYLDVRAPQYHAIFIFLSVAFNTIVTASIVYRLLRASSALRKSLPGWKDSAYKGFVAILVESALPLAACGLARASMEVFDIRASRSMNLLVSTETWFRLTIFGVFVDKLYLIVAAISPQLIIFRSDRIRRWNEPLVHNNNSISLY
ncbi:hypothetical protein CC1G_01498 [Coprinopsis cinerea okayama7|uniref:Uncharacterized protein n=1 Tax=Coprinopsis cinerea (strain Okayama-7 / 130 / ATCC MYA-4618 / FGSC 9003) TaxID=240176 RepID=A8NHT2_COPC7|nr:hypothetical protein CC1G_01498 [Coprinopsis cinerea okayama7\|eukprot:XP_001833821.2 hypothetical protein CC1G_01498 [Coprinopsis cinerea okayama7\